SSASRSRPKLPGGATSSNAPEPVSIKEQVMFKKLCLSLLASSVLAPLVAFAAWPERPVQLIVPYAAGGGTDTAARMLAKKLTDRLGQPVIVENKPGAATQIGTTYVAR